MFPMREYAKRPVIDDVHLVIFGSTGLHITLYKKTLPRMEATSIEGQKYDDVDGDRAASLFPGCRLVLVLRFRLLLFRGSRDPEFLLQ